jgi:hypothetical protein
VELVLGSRNSPPADVFETQGGLGMCRQHLDRFLLAPSRELQRPSKLSNLIASLSMDATQHAAGEHVRTVLVG